MFLWRARGVWCVCAYGVRANNIVPPVQRRQTFALFRHRLPFGIMKCNVVAHTHKNMPFIFAFKYMHVHVFTFHKLLYILVSECYAGDKVFSAIQMLSPDFYPQSQHTHSFKCSTPASFTSHDLWTIIILWIWWWFAQHSSLTTMLMLNLTPKWDLVFSHRRRWNENNNNNKKRAQIHTTDIWRIWNRSRHLKSAHVLLRLHHRHMSACVQHATEILRVKSHSHTATTHKCISIYVVVQRYTSLSLSHNITTWNYSLMVSHNSFYLFILFIRWVKHPYVVTFSERRNKVLTE